MVLSTAKSPELVTSIDQLVLDLGMTIQDLSHLPELSPYLILDGHRTANNHNEDPIRGYIEGALFSLRFARIFQELGGSRTTFLIHTLRNYRTLERMNCIFDAVDEISDQFIAKAIDYNIRLRYYGKDIHTSYSLANIINRAEEVTRHNTGFNLNFLTNYSEDWAASNFDCISELPEINVIGRFTKGHYSGAGIPGHADKSNFLYIQQASINENWSDEEMVVLILTLLKAHLSLSGFVGGKTYSLDEKDLIRQRREYELYEDTFILCKNPRKRITSFSPCGPITVKF